MSIIVDDSALKRIQTLREQKSDPALKLRIRVEGGGCSGFQYKLELTAAQEAGDLDFGDAVLTDDISLPFLAGAKIIFEESLVGSEFKIINPNAVSGCGCGTSFAV